MPPAVSRPQEEAPRPVSPGWNGTTWSPLGPGFPNGQVETLAIQPNGDLIAGGWFQAAVPGTGDDISR